MLSWMDGSAATRLVFAATKCTSLRQKRTGRSVHKHASAKLNCSNRAPGPCRHKFPQHQTAAFSRRPPHDSSHNSTLNSTPQHLGQHRRSIRKEQRRRTPDHRLAAADPCLVGLFVCSQTLPSSETAPQFSSFLKPSGLRTRPSTRLQPDCARPFRYGAPQESGCAPR